MPSSEQAEIKQWLSQLQALRVKHLALYQGERVKLVAEESLYGYIKETAAEQIVQSSSYPSLQFSPQLGRWLLGLQRPDDLQTWQTVVAAGLGQQRALVAGAQVFQIAAEVDDAGAAAGGGHPVLQVGAGGQQIIGMAGPVASSSTMM